MKQLKLIISLVLSLLSGSGFCQSDSKFNSGWIGVVQSLAVNADQNSLVVTGSENIHLFELSAFQQTALIKSIKKPIKAIFSADKELIISTETGVLQYNISTGEIINTLSAERCNDIYIDPLSDLLYLSSNKGVLSIFSRKEGIFALLKEISFPHNISSIASSRKFLAFGLSGGQILLYDKASMAKLFSLSGHKSGISSLSFSADERLLASAAARDYTLRVFGEGIVWELDKQAPGFRTGDHHKQVLSIYTDSNKDIWISSLKEIVVYNATGTIIKTISTYPHTDPLFVPLKDKIIYGSADTGHSSESLFVLDQESKKPVKNFSFDSRQVWHLGFPPNHSLVISKENEVTILPLEGKLKVSIPLFTSDKNLLFKGSSIMGIAISKNSQKLTDSLFIYDLTTGKHHFMELPPEIVERKYASDFSLINNNIFALHNKGLHQLNNSKEILEFNTPANSDPGLFARLNQDDFFNVSSPERKIIGGSPYFYEYDQTNKVLNIRLTKSAIYINQLRDVELVKSDHRAILLLYKEQTKTLWGLDLADLQLKRITRLDQKPYAAKLSADNKWLSLKYGQWGNNIQLVNLHTKQLISIAPEAKHIDCITFSPNNKYLLTGNRMGEVEFWNLLDGKKRGALFTSYGERRDYVIYLDGNYDGTEKGIKHLFNPSEIKLMTRKKGLFRKLVLE